MKSVLSTSRVHLCLCLCCGVRSFVRLCFKHSVFEAQKVCVSNFELRNSACVQLCVGVCFVVCRLWLLLCVALRLLLLSR